MNRRGFLGLVSTAPVASLPEPVRRGHSPEWLSRAINASLRRFREQLAAGDVITLRNGANVIYGLTNKSRP